MELVECLMILDDHELNWLLKTIQRWLVLKGTPDIFRQFYTSCSVQFSSVTQSCLTLCDPMNRSTPGLPIHHQWPESSQTHVHWVSDVIQPSFVIPFSSCPQSFPASGSFQMSQLFELGDQSIGISASTSVLPMNTQDFRMDWLDLLAVQGTLKSLL